MSAPPFPPPFGRLRLLSPRGMLAGRGLLSYDLTRLRAVLPCKLDWVEPLLETPAVVFHHTPYEGDQLVGTCAAREPEAPGWRENLLRLMGEQPGGTLRLEMDFDVRGGFVEFPAGREITEDMFRQEAQLLEYPDDVAVRTAYLRWLLDRGHGWRAEILNREVGKVRKGEPSHAAIVDPDPELL